MKPVTQRETDLFQAAVQLTGSARASFLDNACQNDTSLRQRLEALLAAHEQSAANAAESAAAAGTMKVEPADAPDETVGQKIGRYKILERIGEGGFGVVYVADQTESVRRRVALKVIKLGMDTKQVVARFEAERQALAMMDHPNIAKVLDAGATETGRPYFVMELVRGIRITDFCDQNKLSTNERLALFVTVCQAIQHAHQKGVIHRDIKPSNVLVTMHDGAAVAKVIDFGIAKATEGKLTEATVYTQLHQFIGTPAYMSPEQAEMSSLDIDTRSDIYSLGVLLYELLTGRTPFDPALLVVGGLETIRRTICELEPLAPSTKLNGLKEVDRESTAKQRSGSFTQLVRAVRGDLDWIVLKCLEKDRRRRYDTANGLAVDIQRHLAGQTVVAAPPSPGYRVRKFANRHLGAVAAAFALAALLITGVVAFAWQASIARRERDRAIAAEAEAKKRADELAKVSDFQENMLGQIDANEAGIGLMQDIRTEFAAALDKAGVATNERAARIASLQRDLALVNATDTAAKMIDRAILEPSLKTVDAQFKDDPLVDARLRHGMAEWYRVLGRYDKATTLHQSALAIRQRVLGEDAPETLTSLNDTGALLESEGKLPEAEKLYRQALEGRKRVQGEDNPDTIATMGNLGNYLRVQGRYSEAEPLLQSCVEKSRRVLGPDKRDTFIAMNCLGFLYIEEGKTAEAEPLWRDAYEKGRHALGEDDPDVLAWLNNLAGLIQVQGKLKEAEPYFRESVEKHRRIRGEDHPATITATVALAGNLSRQGRYAEAEALLREALEKSRRVLGNDHPETWSCMGRLGNVLTQQGRLAEAESCLRETLAARQRIMGNDHPDTLTSMSQLAQNLVNENKEAEAEQLYRDVIEKSRRVLGKEHPDTLVRAMSLGNLFMQEHRLDAAEPLIRQSYEAHRRVSGENHPETLVALSNLGRLLEMQGKLAEAEGVDRDAMARLRHAVGDDNPSTLNSIAILASLLRAEGKAAEAEPLFREALAGMERKFGKDNAKTAFVRLGLGRTLTDLGRFAEAEPNLKEAEQTLATAQGVPAGKHEQSVQALVALYDAWQKAEPSANHAAAASNWKRSLDAATKSASAKP